MRQPIVFGKYLLLERISVGGMAEVFKAKYFGEEGFEKFLAIKRILPSMAEDEQFITMFIDEAKIAGELSHPNIGQIYELGKIDNAHFIAMEYVWGKDVLQLQNRFRRFRQKMPPVMAAYVASRVCEGLDYAHHKTDGVGNPMHIIHRDVSPQNILVSYSGEVKIIDFGIAKARSRSSRTQAGVLKGKFGYMSPEQVRGLPLDQRSDIFSIGTLLWEMCTGERLFTGETDFATLDKVRNAEAQPPSSVNPGVPPEMDAIIMRALQRNPDQRFQWASDMQEELASFLISQRPVFKGKTLGETVGRMFQAERQREQARLEEYRGISKEDMASFAPRAPENREVVVSLLPLEEVQAEEIIEADELIEEGEEEMEGEATVVGGPAFIFDNNEMGFDPDAAAALEGDDGMPDDEETRLFGGGMGPEEDDDEVEEMTAEPTFIFNAESGGLVQAQQAALEMMAQPVAEEEDDELPDQGPTVLFDVGLGAAAQQQTPPAATAPVAQQPLGAGAPQLGNVALPRDQISATMPVELPPQRSSIIKDVLIGVLVAMVVIMGIVVWRVATTGRANATLVITASPHKPAKVFVDGQFKGEMVRGTPFTLKDVSPKEHVVTLKAAGMRPVHRKVALASGDVKVVSVAFTAAAEENGKLLLAVTPSDYHLRVNGALMTGHEPGTPLALRPGQQYKIRVEKEGYQAKDLAISLKAGQVLKHAVALVAEAKPDAGAAEAKLAGLTITSEPKGARVMVDGKERGQTPLKLSELPAGDHQVQLNLDGYKARSDKVALTAGKVTEMSLTLEREAAAKPTMVAAKGPTPSEPKPTAAKPKPAPRPAAAKPKPRPRPAAKPKPRPRPAAKPRPKPRTVRKPTPKKPAGKVGYLMAMSIPWGAKVLINGRATGLMTPIPKNKLPLKPGKYRVTFVHSGKKFTFPVTIAAGEHSKLVKKLKVN